MGGPGHIEVRLLGAPQVVLDGRPVAISPGNQQAILVALAVAPGSAVPMDSLEDALWGDTPPKTARATLHNLVSRLRRAITPDGEPERIVRRGSAYVLEVPADCVDTHQTLALGTRARSALAGGDPAGALAAAEAGLALWRGPALGEVADLPFAVPIARQLEEARLDTVEDAADAELALGRPVDAVTRLEGHVAAHPLRERACAILMRALYHIGRQADALAAYRRLRSALADELGIDPTAALRDLETAILQQRVAEPAPAAARRRDLGDTVAFLFTDIESSTRRWEGDPDAMSVALAEHDRLLADVCESWAGRVFSHTGDGMCAAFPSAAAAIGAAVDGQFALARQVRAEPLRVRMAVHVGHAERRAGNFFGPVLNRTARLMSVAQGGQVLCSAVAAQLGADQLPADVGLLDLGEVRLADLAAPERVLQVTHPDLPREFPPLRADAVLRTNLPAEVNTFIGREAELRRVADAMAAARLVTIAGPGGAGKTRLALAAARAAADFPDGVWLVDLTPLRDPDLVVPQVAAAMALDLAALAATGRPPREALVEQLRHRRLLLILDNCEHLVDAAAALAHALLAGAPGVVVLATSRETLAVAGEHVVRVAGLALPDAGLPLDETARSEAVTLFCRRAAETAPGFAVTDANAAAVARICRSLDGIPLALELAAARVRLLGAQQLAARLDGLALGGGPRTADPRHRTLAAAIAWSHDLLPQSEQVVLRRLAVFPAPWTLPAAEAVAAAGPDGQPGVAASEVLDIVGRLVDKSLVLAVPEAGDEPRYRLLETIRQFAAARLAEAGETDAVSVRMRTFLLDAAEDWRWRHFDAEWLRWVAADIDSFRAALAFSTGRGDQAATLQLTAVLWSYWSQAGSVSEGAPLLERAAAIPPRIDPMAAVHVRLGLSQLLSNMPGSWRTQVEPRLREAVRIATELAPGEGEFMAHFFLGNELAIRGDPAEALAEFEAAVAAGKPLEDEPRWAYRMPMARLMPPLLRGDTAETRRVLAQWREAVAAGPDSFFRAVQEGMSALFAAVDGDAAQARESAAAVIRTARALGMGHLLVMALVRAVEALLLCGLPDEARPHLDELLLLLDRLGMRQWVGESLELAAVTLHADGDTAAAAVLLGAAKRRRAELDERGDSAIPALTQLIAATDVAVSAALGPDADAAARERGAALDLPVALRLARATVAVQAVQHDSANT